MTLVESNRVAAAGAIAAAALIIFSPFTYWLTDKLALGRGYVAQQNGKKPTCLGIFLHVLVLFAATIGILSVGWVCE